jgi:hypothetical protein
MNAFDRGIPISKKTFEHALTILPIDVTPLQSADESFTDSGRSKSDYSVNLQFSRPLPANLQLMIMIEFNSIMKIDKDYTVSLYHE